MKTDWILLQPLTYTPTQQQLVGWRHACKRCLTLFDMLNFSLRPGKVRTCILIQMWRQFVLEGVFSKHFARFQTSLTCLGWGWMWLIANCSKNQPWPAPAAQLGGDQPISLLWWPLIREGENYLQFMHAATVQSACMMLYTMYTL